MTPLLSVCIATLASRKERFDALRTKLLVQCGEVGRKQADAEIALLPSDLSEQQREQRISEINYAHLSSVIQGDKVWTIGIGVDHQNPLIEILYDKDEGQKPIGDKRQDMLERATGLFICYIDDDDDVPEDYVSSITEKCTAEVDCIGFDIDCYGYATDPHLLEKARVSNRYTDWSNDVDGFRYVRCPHHLMPIRRDLALLTGFPRELKFREDSAYSFKLRDLGVLKNEAFIEKVLYTIWHVPNKVKGQ